MRGADEAVAAQWSDGPALVYGALADALLARAPVLGAVLDVGAGTGVVARVALARGATSAVAVDLSAAMLRRLPTAVGGVVAEATGLPFRDRAFDVAAAGCLLSHLTDPGAALGEMGRVAGAVVASAFGAGWTHPAKQVVDEELAAAGFRPPDWYRRLKESGEPAVADPSRLAGWARAAGLRGIAVDEVDVHTGVRDPSDLVAWRLGMAQHATFVAAMPAPTREALRARAETALAGCGPLVVPLLVLTALQGEAARQRASRRAASVRNASP